MRYSVATPPKWVQVYQYLQTGIQERRWEPGEKISAYQVAQELGVSRYPVQQAMRAIEADGLAKVVPQVGCVISHPSAEEMAEDTLIRAALEELVGRLAAERIGPEQIARLEDVLNRSDECISSGHESRFYDLNREFHGIILEASRNRRLAFLIRPLSDFTWFQESIREFQSHDVVRSTREHKAITQALRCRQSMLAGRLLREHFERRAAAVLESRADLNSQLESVVGRPPQR